MILRNLLGKLEFLCSGENLFGGVCQSAGHED